LWQDPQGSLMATLIALPRTLLNNRLSTWLGDGSFSVYQLHLLIVIPLIALLLKHTDSEFKSDLMRFLIVCVSAIPV
ncbi:acyltransferase, partial [Pantoea agglomerans]